MNPQYQVLRFSPDPEVTEPINVAILVSNGTHQLFFDETFPKLACVAPRFDKQLLAAYLEHLRSMLSQSNSAADSVIRAASAQFTTTEPREIRSDPNSVVPALISKFLARGPGKAERTTRSKYIQTRLEDLLTKRLDLRFAPGAMHRAAPPKDYLTSRVLNKLRAADFKVTRVIDSTVTLVAIDAIDLGDSRGVVEGRTIKIHYGFFQLGKVSHSIETIEKRGLYRAVVIIGDDARRADPHIEVALETIRSQCDDLVSYDHPARSFVSAVKEAAAASQLVS